MHTRLSLKYSMELVASVLTVVAFIAVLQTFIFGRHFIIPTMILTVAVILGNLARYGYRDRAWAKQMLFWFGFILTLHAFFALFWAKAYREMLGASFEYVCAAIVLIMAFLTWQYASRNSLFGSLSRQA
ncbi:MAG: hypothetical protein WD795_07665 [Woeseia sp.]